MTYVIECSFKGAAGRHSQRMLVEADDMEEAIVKIKALCKAQDKAGKNGTSGHRFRSAWPVTTNVHKGAVWVEEHGLSIAYP